MSCEFEAFCGITSFLKKIKKSRKIGIYRCYTLNFKNFEFFIILQRNQIYQNVNKIKISLFSLVNGLNSLRKTTFLLNGKALLKYFVRTSIFCDIT